MSRGHSSSAASGPCCVSCQRMRDEMALLRMQIARPAMGGTAAATATAASNQPTVATPPLLYQLQRGTTARAPAAAASMVTLPAALKPKPAVVMKKAPAPNPLVSSASSSPRPPTATATSSTQTVLEDLDPSCLAVGAIGCTRCPCCAIGTRERDAASHAIDAARALQKKHEAEVVTWQRTLKAMRAELAAAQAAAAAKQTAPSFDPALAGLEAELQRARMRGLEQDKLIRSLQDEHAADQQWIAQLQSQLRGQQQQPDSSHSLDGLSELQRQQLALRSDTEQALIRLQQLFPHQRIGGPTVPRTK